MFGNKELEAGMVAINIRIDNLQKDINKLLELLQGKTNNEPLDESPFKTKEGLFNYKHRKPMPKDE